MEKKELSTEEKAMLLYEAMKPTLDFDGGEEWQNKIIDAIHTIGCIEDEIKPDCIYWLVEIYKMFGRIKETKIAI